MDVKALFEELGRVRITTGSSMPVSDVIEELSGQPVGCDVSVVRDFHSCREGVHCHRCCPSLGLKWVEVPGNCRPDSSEVDNVALQQALRERREFWHSEFEEFKIGERLSPLCFICVDGSYFQPVPFMSYRRRSRFSRQNSLLMTTFRCPSLSLSPLLL